MIVELCVLVCTVCYAISTIGVIIQQRYLHRMQTELVGAIQLVLASQGINVEHEHDHDVDDGEEVVDDVPAFVGEYNQIHDMPIAGHTFAHLMDHLPHTGPSIH